MADQLYKYPRTPHLLGSAPGPDDEPPQTALADLRGACLVVEEKLDGANCGLSFLPDGTLRLQSRGHFLTGGPRERHFALFKTWAASHQAALFARLGDRYVLYGEWLYAKHTIFYDALPHYFLEFDVLDTATGRFLSTQARRSLLAGLPVASVPVLWTGPAASADLGRLLGPSTARTAGWRERLVETAQAHGLDIARALDQTDPSDWMEGLYLKIETPDAAVARYKLVRGGFLQTVLAGDGHWLDRPILPNLLRPGVDLFDPGARFPP